MMKVGKLFFLVAVCELVGILGSYFTIPQISGWYQTLNKPPFNPPNWIFGPVWTALYAIMGVAIYMVVTSGKKIKGAIAVFGLQLALNLLWSLVFFGLHQILLALAIIILLWLAIAGTIIKFAKISKTAAYLLVPYLLWVTFASMLNFFVVILN